jgi:hypothetical protein
MPNWKDPKAYKKKLDRAGWAWEFMRRNPIYRADHAKAADAWAQVPRQGQFFMGGGAYKAEQFARELGAKWGQLDPIANPDRDEVPRFLLAGPIEPDGEQVAGFYLLEEQSDTPQQQLEFATLTFDLRRPLNPQLSRARLLLRERKKSVATVRPVRSSESQWPLYLRVLDAKEAGAKTSEIIAAIYAYRKLREEINKIYAAQDRVADHWKRARQLRDDPLSLIY